MSPERFRMILLLLGEEGKPITAEEAAYLFERSPRQIQYYLSGRQRIPLLVAEKAHRLFRWANSRRQWRVMEAQERREAVG